MTPCRVAGVSDPRNIDALWSWTLVDVRVKCSLRMLSVLVYYPNSHVAIARRPFLAHVARPRLQTTTRPLTFDVILQN